MSYENRTLGSLLEDTRIAAIADDAIRGRNLKEEPLWNMTLKQLKEQKFFTGEIGDGMKCLYQASGSGSWYYPLYSKEECAEDPARQGVNVVRLPSDAADAGERPFILLVPGGGFVNVWSLTEGWPVAEQFNRYGYNVFVLTYQVDGEERLLEKNMQDFARALDLIKERKTEFHVQADRYITCGFSAGGYLVCLWNTKMGYAHYGHPKPQAVFPIYPVTTLKPEIRYGEDDPAVARRLYGCSLAEAAELDFEITDHAEGFPPCAIFVAEDDELVNPENSRILIKALEKLQIPCRLEMGKEGRHGFADGSGTCMAGWTQRAVQWYETLQNTNLEK